MNRLSALARWIFGLFYAFIGATWFAYRFMGKSAFGPNPDETAAAKALAAAFAESGFIDPVIVLTCLLGGLLLLVRRTAPLAICVLAPLVTIIFLFHVCLNDRWFYWIWGSLQLAWLLMLSWLHRASFRPLWQHGADRTGPATRRRP